MNTISFDMTKPRDIVGMGRSNVDLYPDQYGSTNQVTSYSKFVGGSPANTSVQIAKMGLDTAFISKVSQDNFGQFVRYYLAKQGIDVSHVTDVADPSIRHGLAVAEQPEKGSINYFFYRDDVADLHLSMDDIDESFIAQFKALLISGTSLCVSPAREAVLLAMEYAKRNNVRIIFDPDFRATAWKSYEEAALYYWIAASRSDLIFGTREELDVVEYLYQPNNTDDQKTASLLLAQTPSMVCIKRGEDGSNVYIKDGTVIHGGIYPARVIKVLGAGDSFAGSFSSALVRGKSIEEALRRGAASASLTISGRACSGSMPTLELLEDYLKAYDEGRLDTWPQWEKIATTVS